MSEQNDVFRIVDRKTGAEQAVYMHACRDQTDFASLEDARSSNVHGVYQNRVRYGVRRYRVTYEILEDDCDPPTERDVEDAEKLARLFGATPAETMFNILWDSLERG